MESPLSFIVEHFMKRFLQDYIQKESLVLDSFSLFDTSINLKNIELKEQIISRNDLNIHILSGSIYELIIEGSIFERKVSCDLSNVSLTIFIENLDNIIFTKTHKQPIITKDPTKQYSFEKNQYNTLYTILNQISILNLRLSNIKINIYTVIEDVLLHLTLFLGEISTKPNNKEKTFNQEDFSSMMFNISNMDLSINFGKVNNPSTILQQISQGKEDIYQTCQIIENTTAIIQITAGKLRFDRDEKKYSNDKIHYQQYSNFSTYERNNEVIINLKENNILISDTLIINCMILFKKIKNKQMIKRALCLSGFKKFQRIVNNIKNFNQTKPRGYKFCTPQSDKAKKYLTIIKYLTYIGLILKQRKIIHFDISFYLCEKLVNEYKNHIIGDDHFLIDYLITENTAQFLESPPISGGSSIFLNMQLFSSLKAATKNNTLKGFMLFILQKFMICKECIKNYESYDDFYFISFQVEKVDISLIRSVNNNTMKSNGMTSSGINTNNDNKTYLNKLENTVRCLRNEQTAETSNVLLKFELIHNDFSLYTNLKEHYLLKNTALKLYIYDISYRKLSLDNQGINKVIPIFKIEYQAEVSLYIINSTISHIGIDIPSFILLIDPFYVYFCILYFKSIMYSLSNAKFQNNLNVLQTLKEDKEKEITPSTNCNDNDNKTKSSRRSANDKNNKFLVKDLQLHINVIMITFAHSNDNKYNEDNESIALQLTEIDFSMHKQKTMLIKLLIGELLLGTISIFNLKKYLAYEQTLWFETNIFSMFDINQIIELSAMQKEGLVTTLNTIVIELQQKDLYNFYKLYLEFISLFQFLPVFEAPTTGQMIQLANNNIANGIATLEEKSNNNDSVNTTTTTSLFFALVIEKIIINIILNETMIGSFRHIIAIIQDTSLIKMKTGDVEISSIGFKSINCYERQEDNILNELFSSKCANPIDFTLLTKDSFCGIYQAITKLDENGFPLDNPENDYEGYVIYTECRNVKRIISSLPHCFVSFDYNLLACITEFVNFKGATSEFAQITQNYLQDIKEDFPMKYHQSKEKEKKLDRHQNINDITATIRIAFTKVLLYEKREVFLELTLDQLIINYTPQVIIIDILIKTICDMRPISQKKKTILSKKSSSGPLGSTMVGLDKVESALKASIAFKSNEKSLNITIDNAKFVFLMRVVMDIVEYFYKIIFLDILEHTNYDILYDPTKTIKQRVENITEQNQKSKVVMKHHNRKYTNRSIMNKSSRTTGGKYKSNLSQTNNSFIQQEKELKKMKISITVRNFDVALCMNSLKDDELILSSSEFEFSTVFDKDREEIVLSYFNNKKANQQMSFNMNKVDFFAKLKDCKIRKIIERNTTHMKSSEISIVNMIKDNQIISDTIDQTTGSLMLLIEANQWENILSTMKILVIIPYMKVKLYNDIYEEMLRLVFENLNEARTIISQSTIRGKRYFDAQVHDYDDIYKRFTIANDIIIFNEECIVNVYNYPSKCTLHRIDKASLQHSPNMNCEFGHKNPSIEIDKMCQITLSNLYNLMRFYNSGEKNIFLSLSDMEIKLNNKMTPYKDYTSHILIKKIDKEKNKITTIKSGIATSKTKVKKTIEIKEQHNNSNTEISEWVLIMDMTQKKKEPMILNMSLTKLQINYCQISLMALNNFFGRFFNYYKNKRVKNVDHNNFISKRMLINITNSEVLFKPNRSVNQLNLYEVKIYFDMKITMNNDGNTCIGPFTSYKEISLDMKSGFINSIKDKDKEINPFGGKMYCIQNQFLDNFKLNYSTYAKCEQKWQDKDRYCYTFIKYGDSRFTPFDVNVINDDPIAYRDYIRLLKFKEDEEIPINVSFTDNKNNNNINHDEILLNDNNNNHINIPNEENQSDNIILHNDEDDEHSILTSQPQISFPKKTTSGGNGIIRISLSLCQLFRLETIANDLKKNLIENAKYILAVSTSTKFSEIPYKTYMAYYFSDIEMKICDSQFNAQLFQIVISKLMGMRNNTPNSPKLIEGLTKLMKQYEYSRAEPLNIEDKEFIDDTLIKFLFKINYYNSNQSKKKKDGFEQMLMPQMNQSSCEVNDVAYWEPFIEPLPAKFTYLVSEKSKYVKFDILSLMPSYSGIRGMCRQKKFHSLNINFNERLMEIFNLLLKDYERTKEVSKNKEESNPKSTIDKTLTVKNLTEYTMLIETSDNLEEKGSSVYQSKAHAQEELDDPTIINRHLMNNSIIILNDEAKSDTPIQSMILNNDDDDDDENEDDEEQVKNTFYFQYHPCKRINDKDEINVCFIAPIYQPQRPEKEATSVIFDQKKRKNIYPSINNSKYIYGQNEQSAFKRGWKKYNIERPCKYFNIQRNKKNQLNLNIAEERDELRKNFDNKASILLKGEHFLVCEIEINQEGNKKLVTFRSNEGIKNELDFPVKIIFIVKDKARKSDMKIVLLPGQFFFIPPMMLDNIKEIQLKPVAYGNKLIHFGCDSFPYNETSLRQHEDNNEKIYIARCPIKEVRTYTESQKKVPFNDHIVFCIIKKSEKIDNEFLDDEIKNKIDFIRNYQNYNYDRSNKIDNRQNDISKIISDTTYILIPIMRFHNYLPRELTIEKRIPSDFQNKKVKESSCAISNYFDIENFFKIEKEARRDFILDEAGCKQNQYADIQQCNYENYKMQRDKDCFFDYSTKTIIKTGEYMSIYEPFILSEKGQNYLRFHIEVNEDDHINLNSQHRRPPISPKKDKKETLKIDIKPFFFPTIIKAIKQTELGNSLIEFPKILKENINKCACEHSKNYFLNTLEVTENRVLNSYLFCPFLFLNSSDMNLEIRYQRYVKRLPGHKKSAIDYTTNTSNAAIFHKFDLNRMVMFCPTADGRFSFEMGHVTLQSDNLNNNTNNINIPFQEDNNKKEELQSHWEKIQIFNISKYGGITVDLTSKTKKPPKASSIKNQETILLSAPDNLHESQSGAAMHKKQKKSNSVPVEEKDKKLTFSLQMQLLPKYSTLILITSAIHIGNHTQKDIYVYHLPMNKSLPIKSFVLKAMTSTKFHYLINYYSYVQLSFEDKYIYNDKRNFSGLINFSHDELKNKEFFIALGDPKKEPLIAVKIYEEKGSKFVLLTQREEVNQYPYVIINKLNIPITYKQKENLDDESNEINVIYQHLEKDFGISKRIVPLSLKEYTEFSNHSHTTNMNISNRYPNSVSDNLPNNISENKTYYTWEEPLLYDKEKNCNILEIILFGSKFDIDPQEIQKDVPFSARVNNNKDNYIENINDESISKGKIRITEKKFEYQYELYKHTLILKSTTEGEDPIVFELHDKNLTCERNYNGNFTMKSGMKEFEMFCVSIDETNNLVEKIFAFSRKAKEFSDEFVIKKVAKNKCIFIEITKKKDIKQNFEKIQQTHFYLNIENVGIAFMCNHNEFMYIWLRSFYSYIQKECYATEKDNNVLYREIVFKLKDYQIDNYSKHTHYPVILSPLSDKSYDPNYKDYCNFLLVINNLQMGTELYQVEFIYANFTPIDLRFENKFLENMSAFLNKVMVCFNNRKTTKDKSLNDFVIEIDSHKFIESNKHMASETRIHVKKFCIDDIKICFSLKFDNIDLFLQTRSFLFMKPLIEELGLRILNLDSTIFAIPNYTKNNISQSTDDFIQMIISFLCQQFFSELVKALGGISSITSMQIVENFNNNILSNMKGKDNRMDRYKTRKGFKEFYRAGYENISTVVGGIFILVYKMMATAGKIFATLTLDDKYMKRRSYIINKSIKSLSNGLTISIQVLMCALFYMFAQFYYIPHIYFKSLHWILALLFTTFIIMIGIVWKPICGIFDCLTKSLETIGVSINDILADRVKIYARFPRKIKENNLHIYNSLEALALFALGCIDLQHAKKKTEDVCMAIPGLMNKHHIILLMTLDRLMIVKYKGEFLFREKLLIHFSTFELFSVDLDENEDNEEGNEGIRKSIHNIEVANKLQHAKDKKYDTVQFEKKGNERIIHVFMNRRKCLDFYGKTFEIKLIKMNNRINLTANYDTFVNTIVSKKK